MKKKIAEGKALGLKYEIFDNTGIIDHIEFSKKMLQVAKINGSTIRIPESGSEGFSLLSKQRLQLQGDQGKIELHDMDAIGNNGQELTLFQISRDKNSTGSYFSSVNHNTRQTISNARCMREQLFPWYSVWSLFIIAMAAFFIDLLAIQHKPLSEAIILLLSCFPVILLPLFISGSGVGLLRSMAVRRNRDFKAYAQALNEKLQLKGAELI